MGVEPTAAGGSAVRQTGTDSDGEADVVKLALTSVTALSFFLLLTFFPVDVGLGQDESPRWASPPLERSVSVRDGSSDRRLTLDELYQQLAQADVVFVGESHTDETTHRMELAIYEALLKLRQNRVALAMEMFERDAQAALDAYLGGELDEAAFRERARPWENYRTAYRPLVERAKAAKAPLIASNFPRSLRSRLAAEGPQVLQSLEGPDKRLAPAELLPNTDAYWRRVDNAVRGHAGMMRESDRLHSTQSLWDNAMGESCARALDQYPGHLVLHINGDFHSQYWDGTVHQLRRRKPDARVKTVSLAPVGNPAVAELRGAPVADYIVFVEARASDINEGAWSVHASRDVKYRLRLPEGLKSDDRVPLLIWFVDDGLTASDGIDLWQSRLGTRAAIIAVEPPYRQVEEDLGVGGRWFWPDSYSSDIGGMVDVAERIWGYAIRHFPIDASRVVLAGEGTGATVAAGVSAFTDRIDAQGLAIGPRQYLKLRDMALPLPESWGKLQPPNRRLTVLGGPKDEPFWTAESAAYREVGVPTELAVLDADPWSREGQIASHLERALGLIADQPSAGPAVSPAVQRSYLLLESDSPRGRQWARLQALWHSEPQVNQIAVVDSVPIDSNATRFATEIRPSNLATAGALPRCPGPFGGTTVLVLPPDSSDDAARDWLTLVENDPLAKQSRFYRTRIARSPPASRLAIAGNPGGDEPPSNTAAGIAELPDVLAKLLSENRKNVLLVPAVFYADADWLRRLRKSLKPLEEQMTLQWSPGLGGSKEALKVEIDLQSEPPVAHELTVTIQPDNHQLVVEDRVHLPASLRRANTVFRLNSNLRIIESSVPMEELGADEQQGAKRYRLAGGVPGGTWTLRYEGAMDFGLSDQKEEYTRGFRQTRGVLREEGIYLDADSDWIPEFDERLLRFSLNLQLPDHWHVVSQGKGSSRDGQGWARWTADGPMDQIYLVGGPLQRETDAAGGVEIQVYLRQRDDALTRKYLDTGARYLEMYRNLIGPYPYAKFALVENFWETGYGMPSFTLLGPQVIRFPFILHSSYPHEILHNWWGNSVFVDYEQGNWCEGLTAYMADHLIQEQRGTGAEYRRNTLQRYRDYVRDARDFPLNEFRSRHNAATEAVGYGKSLMLFHMLRRQLGDDAFRAGLGAFYRQYRGQKAGFEQIRQALESRSQQSDSPWNLKPVFEQWLTRTGAPQLALRDVAVQNRGAEFLVRGRLEQLQKDEPFLLQVPLVVQTAAGSTSQVLEMASRELDFSVPVDRPPLRVAVDPSFDLFRYLDPNETPPTIGQIFGQPKIVAVLSTSPLDREKLDSYRQLIEAWRSDEHAIEILADTQLDQIPEDRAVWFLGAHNLHADRYFPDSQQLSRAADGTAVRLAGENVQLANHCLVVIQRHPHNRDQAVGWLTLDPVAAAAGLGRKLPHYGKYSYLAFSGDEPTNVVKGQWDTTGSPLVVDLRASSDALAELPPVFSSRALQAHVEWLAAPERRGRGLGTPEIADAAEYIVKQLQAAGLQPGGDDGSWLQKFTVEKGPDGKPVDAYNVIGVLPGKRADWSTQSIVLSAHYDHLGLGWPDVREGSAGQIHPGADDNASGVAVLLELTKLLAAEGGGSRNLVVIAFSAEEAGRLGSQFYVDHPRFPLNEIRGAINLDAVGRLADQPLSILGTGTADEWQHIFRGCTFVTGIPSKNVVEGANGSDQWSFIERGIPAVQIFSGPHGDYHRPSDTPDKVDPSGLVKVAAFVKESVTYMLEREPPLTVKIAAATGQPAGSTPPPTTNPDGGRKVLFGAVPAFDYQGQGVKLDSVVADSPAATAGLRAGDILVKLDKEKIANLQQFSNLLKQLQPDQQVTAHVLRDGKELAIKVTLRKR
jgi:uncharacterized iron-regulated protein